MLQQFKKFFRKNKRRKTTPIDPDEIFLDSQNLPNFDTHQFEGRIERPIPRTVLGVVAFFVVFIGLIFTYKVYGLEVVQGQVFRNRSDNNSLRKTTIYADRGVVYDRNGLPLVWNTINPASNDFSLRVYATSTGLSTLLGYIKYPTKDSNGFYYQDKFEPKDGIEKLYDGSLSGKDGTKIIETDVRGNVVSESVIDPPKDGTNLTLSIDKRLQSRLYTSLLDVRDKAGYKGGAGVIMDVHTGEILAASNFPEFDSQTMTDGSDSLQIKSWITSSNHPFLNRVFNGLYTPGSIVKPFVAMGVLDQGVISPTKQILSTGSISVPNPYDPNKPSIFMDWKPQGWVDLRHAIAVSSDVYFYEVGGGYPGQQGIGIVNIEKYTRMFGFGTTTGVAFSGELSGTIPSPEWKAANFHGEAWRLGDTYNTAIGQYGFQVSPVQVVRAVAAIANNGTLLVPTFIKNGSVKISGGVDLDQSYFQIVKEGMRLGVTEGTSAALSFPFVQVASKTGTAQIGVNKDEVNSWVVGFWPYQNPKYAYAVVMERGPASEKFGAAGVMADMLDWMNIYTPEYLK